MSYAVKELFYSLQGEGAQSGRPAVFLRFAGCNLACDFCDTDFAGTDGTGGGRYEAGALAAAVAALWPCGISGETAAPYVVCTGGEPLLQLDAELIAALHAQGFIVAVETNGTIAPPSGLDWICVSPKAGAPLIVTRGQELKLVFPQAGTEPERYGALAFERFFLQPMDGPARAANTAAATAYCLAHPQWRLSLQMHKLVGIR